LLAWFMNKPMLDYVKKITDDQLALKHAFPGVSGISQF